MTIDEAVMLQKMGFSAEEIAERNRLDREAEKEEAEQTDHEEKEQEDEPEEVEETSKEGETEEKEDEKDTEEKEKDFKTLYEKAVKDLEKAQRNNTRKEIDNQLDTQKTLDDLFRSFM